VLVVAADPGVDDGARGPGRSCRLGGGGHSGSSPLEGCSKRRPRRMFSIARCFASKSALVARMFSVHLSFARFRSSRVYRRSPSTITTGIAYRQTHLLNADALMPRYFAA